MTRRAILVTGSSRGIGRAIAQRFAAGGDRVAVHHRDSAALAEQLASSLPGEGHVVVRADLSDPDAVRDMVDTAAAGLGGLDVLVNNAGAFGRANPPHPVFSKRISRTGRPAGTGSPTMSTQNASTNRPATIDGMPRPRGR